MRLPNFLIIGAARSGTTSLHYTLAQHPEIFVSPIKETNFFLFDEAGELPSWVSAGERRLAPRTLEAYAALFDHATERHRAVGEASPSYLHPPVAPRIKARLPDVQLIAILRQPVEQALSIFATWQGGSLPEDRPLDRFVEALGSPQPGPEGALPLAEHGLYHRHLEAFFEHFDRRQIRVVLFDDLERDSPGLFAQLFEFLGVDPAFRLDPVERYNATGAARSALLHRALNDSVALKRLARSLLPEAAIRVLGRAQHRLRRANLHPAPGLPPELRRRLTERYYGQDLQALERLLGRDLGLWLD
jgi:sulfotransferase family protein